jgi:hypothetical protein
MERLARVLTEPLGSVRSGLAHLRSMDADNVNPRGLDAFLDVRELAEYLTVPV